MKCELGSEREGRSPKRVTPPYESLERWSEGGAVRHLSVKRRDCDGIAGGCYGEFWERADRNWLTMQKKGMRNASETW